VNPGLLVTEQRTDFQKHCAKWSCLRIRTKFGQNISVRPYELPIPQNFFRIGWMWSENGHTDTGRRIKDRHVFGECVRILGLSLAHKRYINTSSLSVVVKETTFVGKWTWLEWGGPEKSLPLSKGSQRDELRRVLHANYCVSLLNVLKLMTQRSVCQQSVTAPPGTQTSFISTQRHQDTYRRFGETYCFHLQPWRLK
jgi:hypothetical protein